MRSLADRALAFIRGPVAPKSASGAFDVALEAIEQAHFIIGEVGVPQIDDEHDALAFALVPHLVRKRIVEHYAFAGVPGRARRE